MKKIVIFDLDGTLIDSVHDIADCVNLMLEKYGYQKRKLDEIKQMIGNGARNLVKRAIGLDLSASELDERLKVYDEIYTNCGCPKTKVFDGMAEVLRELKSRGFLLGIVTNKQQSATEEIYNSMLKEFNFDCVVGQRKGLKIKPDPDGVYSILENCGVSKENAYFVGDGETDVQVAINAGVKGIAGLWGYRTRAQLEAVGAKVFATIPQDLSKIIL